VKKRLAIIALCLVFFVGGWILHYFYPTSGFSLKAKSFQRRELIKTLRLLEKEISDVDIIEEEDVGSYTRRLLRFRWQGISHEAYLLIPHQAERKVAAVLALHGHNTSKDEVIGKNPSPFGVDYGLRLIKAGFCVLVPDIPFSENRSVEDHVALNLIMIGKNLTGMRVAYLKALLAYLSSLPFVDPERLGCIGWSMGGGLAMYLSAVDKRVKVVAISGYLGTYKGSFMRIRQTTDNYIPGILNFGEMADVACLIAPRPLWLENAERDPEFPQEAFMQGIEELKRCYKGREGCLQWQVITGRHRFEGQKIEEWFKKWL
jgi:hypothetical protein